MVPVSMDILNHASPSVKQCCQCQSMVMIRNSGVASRGLTSNVHKTSSFQFQYFSLQSQLTVRFLLIPFILLYPEKPK